VQGTRLRHVERAHAHDIHAQQLTQAGPHGDCDKRPAGGPGWPACTRAARSGSPAPPAARRRAPVRRPPPRARAGRRRARGPPPPHVRRAPPQHPARPAARGAGHERGRFAASEAALQADSGRARCRVARRLAGGRRRRAPHRLEQDGQQAGAASSLAVPQQQTMRGPSRERCCLELLVDRGAAACLQTPRQPRAARSELRDHVRMHCGHRVSGGCAEGPQPPQPPLAFRLARCACGARTALFQHTACPLSARVAAEADAGENGWYMEACQCMRPSWA